ncbi:5934_t:CDS:1, partial [Scutellospora calospora]
AKTSFFGEEEINIETETQETQNNYNSNVNSPKKWTIEED